MNRLESLHVGVLEPMEGNPQKVPEDKMNMLVENIRKSKGLRIEPPTVWEYETGKYKIISGHHRVQAVEKAGYNEVICNIITDPEYTEEQAKKDLLSSNNIHGKPDKTLLSNYIVDIINDYDIDVKELSYDIGLEDYEIETILEDRERKNAKDISVNMSDQEQVEKEIMEADRVVFQFSGGRDSCIVLNEYAPILRNRGVPFEAVFVDTGAEFRDLEWFVIKFCEERDVGLKIVHPKKSIIEHYNEKKCFPSPAIRECIHQFINDPFDAYVREFSDKVVVMRGGRSDQKVGTSKNNTVRRVEDKVLVSPYYNMPVEEYKGKINSIEHWNGYDKGLLRTCCYMCPFARNEHIDAMKGAYPVLWENFRQMAAEWRFTRLRGDSYLERFTEYWSRYGVKVKKK